MYSSIDIRAGGGETKILITITPSLNTVKIELRFTDSEGNWVQATMTTEQAQDLIQRLGYRVIPNIPGDVTG